MIACIDGGLFCVGIPLFLASGGLLWLKKKFKWCKKSCHCKCHVKLKGKPWRN